MTASGRKWTSIRVLALLLVAAMAGCEMDIAEDRYSTLADARADRLFERGWLPDVLPLSSVDIHTVNNLDVSTSTGSFRFLPSEGSVLFAKLTAGVPAQAPFSDWSGMLAEYKQRGFTTWSLRQDDMHWAFFCLPERGRCEYTAW
jgi:hypothetical protein